MNRLEWECPRAGTTFSNRAVNIRLFLRSDAIRGGMRSLISFQKGGRREQGTNVQDKVINLDKPNESGEPERSGDS